MNMAVFHLRSGSYRLDIDALFLAFPEVQVAGLGDPRRARRDDGCVREPRLAQQPGQRLTVVHPEVMPRSDHRPPRPFLQSGGPVKPHVDAGHEPVRVPARDVVAGQSGEVGRSYSHHAAGPEHPIHLGQERACLGAVEMLDHVRAVDRRDRVGGARDTVSGFGESDFSALCHFGQFSRLLA
jgi:hypothetical protein